MQGWVLSFGSFGICNLHGATWNSVVAEFVILTCDSINIGFRIPANDCQQLHPALGSVYACYKICLHSCKEILRSSKLSSSCPFTRDRTPKMYSHVNRWATETAKSITLRWEMNTWNVCSLENGRWDLHCSKARSIISRPSYVLQLQIWPMNAIWITLMALSVQAHNIPSSNFVGGFWRPPYESFSFQPQLWQ